jgi:hypothetical protein
MPFAENGTDLLSSPPFPSNCQSKKEYRIPSQTWIDTLGPAKVTHPDSEPGGTKASFQTACLQTWHRYSETVGLFGYYEQCLTLGTPIVHKIPAKVKEFFAQAEIEPSGAPVAVEDKTGRLFQPFAFGVAQRAVAVVGGQVHQRGPGQRRLTKQEMAEGSIAEHRTIFLLPKA